MDCHYNHMRLFGACASRSTVDTTCSVLNPLNLHQTRHILENDGLPRKTKNLNFLVYLSQSSAIWSSALIFKKWARSRRALPTLIAGVNRQARLPTMIRTPCDLL